MRPDTKVLHDEAEDVVKDALAEYARTEEHGTRDVLIYLASERLEWNALQGRAGMSPTRLKEIISEVREHIRARIGEYIEQ